MKGEKETDEIIKHLESNLELFDKSTFPTSAGIYAIGFNGGNFPITSTLHIEKNHIIYIGKAEANLNARDIKTHFESGKSGSSTLRKTLGAILKKKLNLIPIPRSCKEKSSKRFTNYKFTLDSEKNLTEWMTRNLSLSHYIWNGLIPELRRREIEIVQQVCPILNLQNNPNNEWKIKIKELRKCCRNLAEENKNICK